MLCVLFAMPVTHVSSKSTRVRTLILICILGFTTITTFGEPKSCLRAPYRSSCVNDCFCSRLGFYREGCCGNGTNSWMGRSQAWRYAVEQTSVWHLAKHPSLYTTIRRPDLYVQKHPESIRLGTTVCGPNRTPSDTSYTACYTSTVECYWRRPRWYRVHHRSRR